jgi:TorA maturation chaperone TorD
MSELAAGTRADDTSSLRAQRDFLNSHLLWTRDLADRIAKARPHPFYRSLSVLLPRLITADRQFIRSALGDEHDVRA